MGWEFSYQKSWQPAPMPNANTGGTPLVDIGPASLGGLVHSSGTLSLVQGGPYQLTLGFSAPMGTESGLQLILWYATVAQDDPGLNWVHEEPASPSVLADESRLGLALAAPAWLDQGPAIGSVPAEFLSWTGIDEARTVNVAVASANDPTNVSPPEGVSDFVKTSLWGQTSELPTSIAAVQLPDTQTTVPVIAWTGTGNLRLNLLNLSALPGAAARSQAILDETSPCGPNLVLPITTDPGTSSEILLTWVGTDPGASLNILDFSALSSPAGLPQGQGADRNAVVVQTPSLCAPAVVGSTATMSYMAWIDRSSGRLALASTGDIMGPWQDMTLFDLVDAKGEALQPWPGGGLSMVMEYLPPWTLLVACVDSQYKCARVFPIPLSPPYP